jgi:hypothetical protein
MHCAYVRLLMLKYPALPLSSQKYVDAAVRWCTMMVMCVWCRQNTTH